MACTLPSFYTTAVVQYSPPETCQVAVTATTKHFIQSKLLGWVPCHSSVQLITNKRPFSMQIRLWGHFGGRPLCSISPSLSALPFRASCHTMKLLRYTCLSIPPLLSVSCRSSPSVLNDLLEQLVCPCQAWRHCTYILWSAIRNSYMYQITHAVLTTLDPHARM